MGHCHQLRWTQSPPEAVDGKVSARVGRRMGSLILVQLLGVLLRVCRIITDVWKGGMTLEGWTGDAGEWTWGEWQRGAGEREMVCLCCTCMLWTWGGRGRSGKEETQVHGEVNAG